MHEEQRLQPLGRRLELNQILTGEIPWSPFRPGIEIYRLHGDGLTGSSSALLRYAPGAALPLHAHPGYEHIMVLSGSQSDEHGEYPAGTLVVNTPGSRHSVTSHEGCVVFVMWEAPVSFERLRGVHSAASAIDWLATSNPRERK